MATLIPLPNQRAHASRQQGGYVLFLTLITLVVLLFGVLFTMRGTLMQTIMTGNTLQRQKDVQAGDLALRLVQQQIISTSKTNGDVPLEVVPVSLPWFFVPSGTSAWAVPGDANGANANYWAVCDAKSTTQPCWQVVGLPAGYAAKAIVVPSNLPTSDSACNDAGQRTANYYDIFIHTAEASGSTAAMTETVFKLCTPTQQ